MFRVALIDAGDDGESISSQYFQLPWAGESAGEHPAPVTMWHRGAIAPREWVYSFRGLHPDPGGGGIVGLESRLSLDWFPLADDGTSEDFPLLSSITSLAVTEFEQERLPPFIREIELVIPHLTAGDAAFFAAVAFMAEEALRVGQGAVVFTPL